MLFPLGATGGDHRTTSFDEELEYARMSTGIEGAGKEEKTFSKQMFTSEQIPLVQHMENHESSLLGVEPTTRASH